MWCPPASIQPAPRQRGVSEATVVTPGPSRVFMVREKPESRFSTRATTSRPSSFQSTAEQKLKYTQPSDSRAARPRANHCSGGTVTARAAPSPPAATPNRSWMRARASAGVTSVDLRRRRRALARRPEVRDLVLEDEEAVEQGFRRRRAARHVDVHGHDAVHALHHVIAVTERPAR